MEKGYQEAFPPDGIGTWFSTSLLSRLIRPLSSVLNSSLHLYFSQSDHDHLIDYPCPEWMNHIEF